MRISLENLGIGDFFTWESDETESKKERPAEQKPSLDIYQKIEKVDHYNAVLINSGKPCVIFPSSPILKKVSVELKIIFSEE